METDTAYIASAWTLVEKFIEAGWEVCVEYANWNEVEGEPLGYSWVCALAYYTDSPDDHKFFTASADTASLAIRRAAQANGVRTAEEGA